MVTRSIITQVNSRMRSIQSGKASDANRLVGMCMGTQKSFGGNAATSYGHANENKTAKSYVDLKIHECGLLVYKDYSFIGGSMDRVRTCKCHPPRAVEIKCPSTMAKKPKGSFGELPFLQETEGQTTLLVNPNHPYYCQVQCYLALSGTTAADLVIWSPQETLTINIDADPECWSNVLTSCIYFFMHFVALAILDRSTRTNLSFREKFLQEHIFKCKQGLPKADNMTSNDEASIMCECSSTAQCGSIDIAQTTPTFDPQGGEV